MTRDCLASMAIVLAGFVTAFGGDDPRDKLLGTWVWRTPPDGNDQYWAISRDGDKWTVKGWYKNAKGVETGSFVGVDPVYSDGVLRFTHQFVKKPFNYKDNVPVLIKVDGNQVKYFWNPTNPKSERLLQRAEDPLVGTWKGKIDNLDEFLTIKNSNGTWSINGKMERNGVETGSFIGTDVKETNGTLSFTRKFVKKPPIANLREGALIVIKTEGENLSYSWSLGDQKGTRALEKYKQAEKAKDDELGKFRGYWTADVATGFRVVMLITMNKDKIEVSANYYRKNGSLAGSFVAIDPTLTDGKLTFSQKFTQKPVSGWRDGKIHTLQIVSDNVLKFHWKDGGTEHFARLKK